MALVVSINAQVKSFEAVKASAKNENKLILIKFSGSDWCAPCIALKKAIFDTPEFESYANEKLILLTADFPRDKKNQLTKEQQEENDKLAEKYNSEGKFPYMVLLDAEGNVLKTWSGFNRKLTVEDYKTEINRYIPSSVK